MPTFGFSAFLKLLCLNERPQRRELRVRLSPAQGGGYDFHRSLRLLCRRFLVENENFDNLLALADGLANSAEARSARAGLEALREWRRLNPGRIVVVSPRTFESPNRSFRVHFTPDFGLEADGFVTAIHIWNTARPSLVDRMVYAALSIVPGLYEGEHQSPPDDFGVLSLPDMRMYCATDVGDYSIIGRRVVSMIESYIDSISESYIDPMFDDREIRF